MSDALEIFWSATSDDPIGKMARSHLSFTKSKLGETVVIGRVDDDQT
jgi:hypothetical protein